MKISKILCIVLCLVMLLGVAACGKTETNEPKKEDAPVAEKKGDAPAKEEAKSDEPITMTMGQSGTYFGAFLYGADNGQCDSAISLVFDYVFITDPVTKEVQSEVLEDWYYEDDVTFVCKIKPGVMFSNGEEADAEDVLFSVGEFYERGKFNTAFGTLNMEKSYTRDQYTAVFVFDQPFGPGITDMNLILYNKDWCHEVGWDSQDFYYNPVGSGPYKCVEYVSDSLIRLELRDDCWDGKDYDVDTWIIKYYPDQATMFIDLQLGVISMCTGISTMDYTNFKANPIEDITVKEVVLNDIMFFTVSFLNCEYAKDINVRKAIAYGVDWEAVGVMGFADYFVQATSMVTMNSPYHKDIGVYEYNPELAKQALEEGGYKPGDITLRLNTMQTPAYKSMGEGIQYYLSQIGIQLDLNFGDIASTIGAWLGPNATDVGFQNNPIGTMKGDPNLCWSPLMQKFAPFQHTVCTDAKFNELAEAALNTVDEAERTKYYAEAQQYIYDNYLTYPISEYSGAIAYRDGVFDDDLLAHNIYSTTAYNLRHLSEAQ